MKYLNLLILTVIFAGCASEEQDLLEPALAKGEQIVFALNSFRAKFGYYPESLDELVPEFFSTSDNLTVLGYSFFYIKGESTKQEFGLSFTLEPRGFSAFVADERTALWYDPENVISNAVRGRGIQRLGSWIIRKEMKNN
jgi:hypothetical protein